MGDRLVLRDAA